MRNAIMYSRREFGKFALAGLPMTVALARGAAKIDGKISGVRIGVQSYSFRSLALDDAIKAMAQIGIGECELFSGHVEPRLGPPGGGPRPPQAGGEMTTEQREAMREAARKRQEETRKWRLSVSMDHFKDVRKKFDAAGIKLQAYNL